MEEATRLKLIQKMNEQVQRADAVVIGAGSGLSTAAGLTYSGSRFEQYFADFINRYGLKDMYSSSFYPFESQEEKWAYWSRHVYYNRYQPPAAQLYLDLFNLIKNKNYFVLTTNVDHQFQKSEFQEEKIFATQGDYGQFRCKRACHKSLYENQSQIEVMLEQQKDCRIPKSLIPKCPVCGGDMEVNLRSDNFFVEDEAWHKAAANYEDFLEKNKDNNILFLELGVGMNTPGIIKYPFWQMTFKWNQTKYICANQGEAWAPDEISEKAICIDGDLYDIINEWKMVRVGESGRET